MEKIEMTVKRQLTLKCLFSLVLNMVFAVSHRCYHHWADCGFDFQNKHRLLGSSQSASKDIPSPDKSRSLKETREQTVERHRLRPHTSRILTIFRLWISNIDNLLKRLLRY
eukprot:scaffold1112_cov195-Alexandrium_tamarense.AAC.20